MALSPTSSHGGGGLPTGWITNGQDADVEASGQDSSQSVFLIKGAVASADGVLKVADSGGNIILECSAPTDATTGAAVAVGGNQAVGQVPLMVQQKAGQTADLVQLLNSSGNPVGGFDKSGYIYTGLIAAPANGALAASQAMLWLDSTNGASKLMVKAKSADGTVVTASIALA